MKINLHGFSLDDALDEILYKLEECREIGDFILEIIHGYKHGTKIKDHLRSDLFLKELSHRGYYLSLRNISNKGTTVFELKTFKKVQEKELLINYCYKCNKTMRPLNLPNTYECPNCGAFKKISKKS